MNIMNILQLEHAVCNNHNFQIDFKKNNIFYYIGEGYKGILCTEC
jgi:hypothetical protein